MSEMIKKTPNQPAMFDPFTAMRDMLRWDPFREMVPQFPLVADRGFVPTFEVRESRDAYVFKADVPGIKREELDITVTGNRLQISGKRDEEKEVKGDTIYTYERTYGSFARAFTMPETADTEHVHSDLKDGVLTLMVPKRASAQTRKIQIGAGTTKS